MGQYQQWLHYREIDQQLHAQLDRLENELALLQERLLQLEQDSCYSGSENNVIQALARGLHMQPSLIQQDTSRTASLSEQVELDQPGEVDQPDEAPEVISPALRAWSSFPHFESPAIPTNQEQSSANTSQPFATGNQLFHPIPHSDMELPAEDLFFDQHSQTDPQLELPWWLRGIAASTLTNQATGLIDQETVRTNKLVQRWIERWGRQAQQEQKPGESRL